MFDKLYERKWLIAIAAFIFLYAGFLLFLRQQLMKVENETGFILKPENSQIILISMIILLYHFAFLGLATFAQTGRWEKIVSIIITTVLFCGLMSGFLIWYNSISANPFLFSNSSLPWYAEEKTKFILANSPFIIFLVIVYVERLKQMLRKSQAA